MSFELAFGGFIETTLGLLAPLALERGEVIIEPAVKQLKDLGVRCGRLSRVFEDSKFNRVVAGRLHLVGGAVYNDLALGAQGIFSLDEKISGSGVRVPVGPPIFR